MKRTFSRLQIILKIVICRFDIKSKLKRGTNVLQKVYKKDTFSTVVKVSKGSDLNRNRLIQNFLEHPLILIPPRAVSWRYCILTTFFLKHFTLSLQPDTAEVVIHKRRINFRCQSFTSTKAGEGKLFLRFIWITCLLSQCCPNI